MQLWVRCGREAGYIPVVPHVRKRLRVSDVIGVVEREKRTQSEYLDLKKEEEEDLLTESELFLSHAETFCRFFGGTASAGPVGSRDHFSHQVRTLVEELFSLKYLLKF